MGEYVGSEKQILQVHTRCFNIFLICALMKTFPLNLKFLLLFYCMKFCILFKTFALTGFL